MSDKKAGVRICALLGDAPLPQATQEVAHG